MLTGNRSGSKVEGARKNEWRYESVNSGRLLVIVVFIRRDVNKKVVREENVKTTEGRQLYQS